MGLTPGGRIDRTEGRRLFGLDPESYDAVRPGHAERVYQVLVERCGLGAGTATLEIGPGTGQVTRRLLELGADPLAAVEPDPSLAEYLHRVTDGRVEIHVAALEELELSPSTYDLAVAASSFHWIDERVGLTRLHGALRPNRWLALWWTLFGESGPPDAFIEATTPLLEGLERSPGGGDEGRPPHALDATARLGALDAAGFVDCDHERERWTVSWDAVGIRGLYGTFSPIARLDDVRREGILDQIAEIAERDFGGRVERTLTTSMYTARKPR